MADPAGHGRSPPGDFVDHTGHLAMNIIRSLMGGHTRSCYCCGAPQTPMSDHGGNPIMMTAHEFRCLKTDRRKLPAFLRVEFQRALDWEKQELRKRLVLVR